MFADSAKISLAERHGKYQVELVEPQCPSSRVTINGVPPDAMVIKADSFVAPDTVFRGDHGECKRADYIIFSDSSSKPVILHIEMKKEKGARGEVVQQLKGSHCFVKYCQDIGKSFWNERDFLKGFRHRFISFGHTSIRKRRTRITRPTGSHDKPDEMLKIDWPSQTQFSILAGG